jgi:hypothetical protein
MLRIRTILHEDHVSIFIYHGNDMLYKKEIMGDINADETVSFSSNNFAFDTMELSHFINDVRAGVPSKFGFDEFDECENELNNDGIFDGIIFMSTVLIFCTCYGKSSGKFYINILNEEHKTLIISDLYTMQAILNEYSLNLHDRYNIICHIDDIELEEPKDLPDETNTSDVKEDKVDKASESASDV